MSVIAKNIQMRLPMSRSASIGFVLVLGSLGAFACNDSASPDMPLVHDPLEVGSGVKPTITSTGKGSTWSQPANMGPALNVPTFNTRNAAISTNGKSLYFGSDRPGGAGGLDLYVSHRENPKEPWQSPLRLPSTINTVAVDNNAFPTPDGHHLFFTSSRPGGCGAQDLWVSHRDNVHDDLGWEEPINLGCTINTSGIDSGPVYHEDPVTGQAMLFFSSTRPTGQGSMDFYVSILGSEGTWGPGVIILELSTPFDDNKLAIRRDGLEMFLSSNRPGGGQDAAGFNIWVSTRETTAGAWSTPVLAIESAGLPAISANGKDLYMVTRQPGSGVGGVPFKNDLSVSSRR